MSITCFHISNIFHPFTFSQLDILTNWLIRETYSLQQEFSLKLKFLRERDSQLDANESQIFNIFGLLINCKLNLNGIEEEIQQLECDLMTWTKVVDNIEMPEVDKCSCRSLRKTDRDVLLEMIENTGSNISQFNNLTADVDMLLKYFGIPRNSYDLIFHILDYHRQILSNTENNMDLMLDKLLIISNLQANANR